MSWTYEDRRFIVRHYRDEGAAWCAKQLKKPYGMVRLAAIILGVVKRQISNDTARQNELRRLHAQGLNNTQIAERMRIARITVMKVLRQLGLKRNERMRDENLYALVKAHHAEGYTDTALAEKIGRPYSTVYVVRCRLGLPSQRYLQRKRARELCQTERKVG